MNVEYTHIHLPTPQISAHMSFPTDFNMFMLSTKYLNNDSKHTTGLQIWTAQLQIRDSISLGFSKKLQIQAVATQLQYRVQKRTLNAGVIVR